MRLVMNEPVERMDRPYARRWWALLVLCLSLLIIVMANTALTVAAPDMTKDLGLSSADLQWVIDGYTVPYAALMLLLGAIGDKYSRRGALILGLVVFGGGAIAGSLVGSSAGVIAARAVMGVGAALIMRPRSPCSPRPSRAPNGPRRSSCGPPPPAWPSPPVRWSRAPSWSTTAGRPRS